MKIKGSVVNQIEISGFPNEKEALKFRRSIKSSKSIFDLSKIDKSICFLAQNASWKIKENYNLIYLFITEEIYPEEEIKIITETFQELNIQHLIISPGGEGILIHNEYSTGLLKNETILSGRTAKMLGDLIQGGFN